MKPHLLITVDTELSNFPGTYGLWGRPGGEDWGLPRMLKIFGELGIPGTFFVDVYAGRPEPLAEQRRAVEAIAAAGQDVQLHTHPGPAFDPARPRMRDYSLGEQQQILQRGARLIEEWSGRRPTLHRGGDWGVNRESLEALRQTGFRADFSASVWSGDCALDRASIGFNGWGRLDGLLCGVGTCYRDRLLGRLRRVDLGGASFAEVREMLGRGANPMILTLHSFSFMSYNRARTRFYPNPAYVERLRTFVDEAVRTWGYRPSSAAAAVAEIEALPDASLPRAALPVASAWASAAGLAKSVYGRIAARLQ
jgi:hypothetical protein